MPTETIEALTLAFTLAHNINAAVTFWENETRAATMMISEKAGGKAELDWTLESTLEDHFTIFL